MISGPLPSPRSAAPAQSRPWEQVFAFVLLLVYAGWLLPLLFPEGSSGGEVPVVGWSVHGVLGLGVVVLLGLRWRRALWVALQSPALWLLAAYAGCSAFWSQLPARSVVFAVALGGTTLCALYLASTYTQRQLALLVAGVLAVTALASLVVGLAAPGRGLMGDPTGLGWQGVYGHKNLLGMAMGLGLAVWPALILTSRGWVRLGCAVLMALSGVLLVLSHSVTALVGSLLVLGLWSLRGSASSGARPSGRRTFRLVLGSTLVALVAVFLILSLLVFGAHPPALLQGTLTVLGRSATFTGRVGLWGAVWAQVQRALWFGWGYGGFWAGPGSPAQAIWDLCRWPANHAHNGFLDALLQLGWVGLILLLLALVPAFRLIVQSPLKKEPEGFLPVATFAFLLTINLTESALLEPKTIYYLLLATELLLLNSNGEVQGGEARCGSS